MDPIEMPELPENIGELGDDALQALASQFKAAGESVAESAESDPDANAALVKAAEGFQACVTELGNREAAAAESAANVNAALAVLGQDVPGTAEPIPEPVEKPVVETAAVEPVVLVEANVIEVGEVGDPVGALALMSGGIATGNGRTGVREPLANRRPKRVREEHTAKFIDQGTVDGSHLNKEIDIATLAMRIAQKHDQFRKRDVRFDAPLTIGHAATGRPSFLTPDNAMANYQILRAAQEQMGVAAAGGLCAIPTSVYDVFNSAEEQAPVEGFLTSVPAPRGGIRYFGAPSWPAAAAGVTVTPSSDTTPDKACVVFACPDELTCTVDAVSACAQFDNLTYMAAAELVQVLLEHLAVAHTQAKEIAYLDAIEAGSTAVSGAADVYGAVRHLVNQIGAAAWGYRKRNHISRNAPLDLLIPDQVIPMIKTDMVADHALGMGFLDQNQDTVANELFSALNLNVEFYYDFSTDWGAANAMQGAQSAGPLNELQNDFRAYLYAPGTWVRLDGGELNVGLVRDSTLNNTNDLQLFSEEWVQACLVGNESIALDFNLCPSGVGPEAGTALVCQS